MQTTLSQCNRPLLLLFLVLCSFIANAGDDYAEIVNLTNNGQLQKAEKRVRHKLSNNEIDPGDKINYLALLGDIYFYNDNYLQAIHYYQKAIVIANSSNNQRQLAEQYKNVAISHSQLSEFGEALRWHQRAWQILNKNSWQENETALSLLLSQSSIYGYIGAFEQSMETISKAQKLATKLGRLNALSDSYVRVASIQMENNKPQSALNSLQLVDTELMNDRSSLAWYFSLYSEALIALDRAFDAQQLINKALNYDIKWTPENFNAFEIILLESYLQEHNLSQATQSLNDLANNSDDFAESWLLHYLLAKKYKLENKHKLSFDTNLHAISLFFKYSSYNFSSSKSLFFDIPKELIEATIIDAMNVGLAHSDLIFELYYLAFLAKQPIQIKSGNINIIDTTTRNQAESAVIKDIFFGEASMIFSDRLRLSELQSGLSHNEGFVFYLNIDETYYAMLVTPNNITSLRLPNTAKNINDWVIQLLIQLEANDSDWIRTAHKLDNILIKPLRSQGLEQLQTVHFIQDANLRFLPMDVLIDDQGILLSDRYNIAISTVKSLRRHITSNTKSDNKNNDTKLNLIGMSDSKLTIPSYWNTAYRNLNISSTNLPNVNKELKHLNTEFPNSTLTMADEATETKAKNIISLARGILHFASHGFDNPIAPAYSALVLKPDNNNDGLLQAREISKLTTAAELVVLATCSSAKGGLNGLYGYNSGLAESFIHAGAKTVIGTLWDVKDQQTYQLMQWFYQGISQQLTVSEALNHAKKLARKSGWETYDWSAFILLGQTDLKLKIKQRNHYLWVYRLLIIVSTFIVIFFLLKFSKYNRHLDHN